MSEREVVSQCNDQKLTTDADISGFKLPKIQHPRPTARSRIQNREKIASLPRGKNKITTSQDRTKVARNPVKSQNRVERDEFTIEIEEKLKHVLQNVNSGSLDEDLQDIEEQDFEDAVRYNREKIKMHKKQLKLDQSPYHEQERVKKESPPRMIAKKSSRSLLPRQKKMKQYTESSENKYLSKKREMIKNAANEKSKNLVRKIDRLNSHREPPRPNKPKSNTVSKVQSIIGMQKRKISANLFDNIHSLLQNPKSRASSVMGKVDKKTIEQLQKQIRVINENLGPNHRENTKETEEATVIEEAMTVRDWRRIEMIRGGNFSLHGNSNFQKEMDKINQLQERNAGALNYYVEQQKILVELGLIKKIYPKIENKTE